MNEEKTTKLRWFGIPRLARYIRPYRRVILWMILMGLFGSAMDAVIPLFQQYAINHFIADSDLAGLGVFIGLYAVVILTQTAANYNLDTAHQMVTNAYKGDLMLIPAPDAYSDGKGKDINLQVGAANRAEQRIAVKRFNISCDSLFEGHKMDMSDVDSARNSLEYIDRADANVSKIRSYYGAIQNRLEHTIANLDNVVENTQAAESLIRDTDMAKEMVDYTKTNVLIQAGNAMLSQAMQTPQNVLQLLS